MAQINAYLNFDGNCREAMTFYKKCLGGELTVQTIEGSPIEFQCPVSMKHQVLHASLLKGNLVLMASDMIEPEGFIKGNTIALSLNCNSEKRNKNIFFKALCWRTNNAPFGKTILGSNFWRTYR